MCDVNVGQTARELWFTVGCWRVCCPCNSAQNSDETYNKGTVYRMPHRKLVISVSSNILNPFHDGSNYLAT